MFQFAHPLLNLAAQLAGGIDQKRLGSFNNYHFARDDCDQQPGRSLDRPVEERVGIPIVSNDDVFSVSSVADN